MSEPLVSVVVVTFESEDDIEECVRSVLASDARGRRSSSSTMLRPTARWTSVVRHHGGSPRVPGASATPRIGASPRPSTRGSRPVAATMSWSSTPTALWRPMRSRWRSAQSRLRPAAAMAGCMLLNPDGTEQAGARRYLPTPWRALVRVLQLHRLAKLHPRLDGFLMNREPVPCSTRRGRGHLRRVHAGAAHGHCRRSACSTRGTSCTARTSTGAGGSARQAGRSCSFRKPAPSTRRGAAAARMPIRVELYKHLGMIRFYRKFLRHRYPWS